MTSDPTEQLKSEIEQHVTALFVAYQRKERVYHNLVHTQTVVQHCMAMAAHYDLNPQDRFILFAAAWFHDTGHLFAEPRQHEEESVIVTSRFFRQHPQVSPAALAHIERWILSTKMPQVPCTLLEMILCDADTYHFGTDDFFVANEQVKEEVRLLGGPVDNWDTTTLELLQQHTYKTHLCQTELTPGKERNMAVLKSRLG